MIESSVLSIRPPELRWLMTWRGVGCRYMLPSQVPNVLDKICMLNNCNIIIIIITIIIILLKQDYKMQFGDNKIQMAWLTSWLVVG